MKPFWDDMFFDLNEGNLTQDTFAFKAGSFIRDDLQRVEDAIRKYDGKTALEIIKEIKQEY
jgi:hypothetical protein